MSRSAGRVVLAWCSLYTLAAPPSERARRRAEIAAHVHDATAAWGSSGGARMHLALDCLRGTVNDLLWCNDVRRAHGLSPLVVELMLGQLGATLIAGISITAAFVFSLSDAEPWDSLRAAAVAVAAAVTVTSFIDRAIRRRSGRKGS